MKLHLLNNEKISNRIIDNFEEALPGENIFMCFPSLYNLVEKRHNVYFIEDAYVLPFDLSIIDTVIIHFLDDSKIDFFLQKFSLKKIKCYWIVWGGDMYNNILDFCGFNIYYSAHCLGLGYYKSRILNKIGIKKEVYRRLDFISRHVSHIIALKEEYVLLSQYIGKYIKQSKLVDDFFYYPIDQILGSLKDSYIDGNTVLLGNSSSCSNNHIYAYKFLKKCNLKSRKIVAPLSYNFIDKYRDYIIREGQTCFGENFCPLIDFLPLQQYNELMTSADTCVFASWRQEAFGNIVVALYLGSKVYLSHNSPLFSYFKRIGVNIYELESIEKSFDEKLTVEKANVNRNIMLSLYNKQRMIKLISQIWK